MAGFRTSGVEVSGVVFLRTRPDASVRRSDCHHHRPTVTRASPTTPRCAHRAMPVFWGTTFVAVGNRCFRRSTTGTQRVRYVKASDEQTGHCWSSWISSQSRHKRATRSRISFKFSAQTLRRQAPFRLCKISRTRATKSLPPRRLCCDTWSKPPVLQAWDLVEFLPRQVPWCRLQIVQAHGWKPSSVSRWPCVFIPLRRGRRVPFRSGSCVSLAISSRAMF